MTNLPFTPMKATDYDESIVKHWPYIIMQPKLRGLCCWLQDGIPHTRKGGCYNVFPNGWFPDLRSSIHLIGELWHPKMTQQDIQGAVVRNDFTAETEKVRLYIFDCYDADQPGLTQIQRFDLLNELPNHPHIEPINATKVTWDVSEDWNTAYLFQKYEGSIYRHPDNIYTPRTESREIQKRKPWFSDEGVVVGIEISDKGKRAGLLKHFVVQWKDKTFCVGGGKMNNKQLKEFLSLPLGTIITFEYQELTNLGTPQHAQFVAVRTDL